MGLFRSVLIQLATAPTTARGSAQCAAPTSIFLPLQTDLTTRSSAIYMRPGVHDFSREAIGFFTSIRIPAALIAGSSLGALFVMIRSTTQPDKESYKRNVITIWIYHALSLLSLLLSLNVIVTATSASNTMLIQNVNPLAQSAYHVLMREMKFEYLTTRWSFYAALLCFLKAVLFRALLEFDLLRKDRLRPALLVTFSVASFFAHVLHVVNDCLYSFPNFYQMTLGVLRLYIDRVWHQKNPMLLISFFSGLASLVTFISLVPKIKDFAKQTPQDESI